MSSGSHVGGRVVAIVATVALAVAVGVLATLALQRGAGAASDGVAGPAPTFTFGDRATAMPTPSPSQTAASPDDAGDADNAAQIAAAGERFLAVDGRQLWRATAGLCAAGTAAVAPVVEFSTDGGDTWNDVTPPDARQVLNIAVLGVGEGEVIAATGESCAPAALRTYTAGRAWEAYPQVLAASTYVSPTDRTSVVVAGAPSATAPCADARSARTSRASTGIVCAGTAYVLEGDSWTAVTEDAVALDAVAGTIVVAHASDACTGGVAVTRFTGTVGVDLGCVSDVDAASPAAVSVLDSALVFWSGDAIRGLD